MLPLTVHAADVNSAASNASDFQPQTQNPQSNVDTLQTNDNTVQPNSSVNQTNLPAVPELKVSVDNKSVSSSTIPAKGNSKGKVLWIVAGAGTVLAIILFILSLNRKNQTPSPAEVVETKSTTVEPTDDKLPVSIYPEKSPKPKSKKKLAKKRHSKKKRK